MTKVALIILTGIATVYGPYPGSPLYCDRGNDLLYDDRRAPWVAVDPAEYRSGRVRCGDWLWLTSTDGYTLLAQALDAGPLYAHQINDWPGQRIVVDVPLHLATWPLTWGGNTSTPVQVVNLSAQARAMVTASPHLHKWHVTNHHPPNVRDKHCFSQKTAAAKTSPQTLPWLSPVSVHDRASRSTRLACTRQGVKLAAMASSTALHSVQYMGRVASPEHCSRCSTELIP